MPWNFWAGENTGALDGAVMRYLIIHPGGSEGITQSASILSSISFHLSVPGSATKPAPRIGNACGCLPNPRIGNGNRSPTRVACPAAHA